VQLVELNGVPVEFAIRHEKQEFVLGTKMLVELQERLHIFDVVLKKLRPLGQTQEPV
jgi:hypothetical protein